MNTIGPQVYLRPPGSIGTAVDRLVESGLGKPGLDSRGSARPRGVAHGKGKELIAPIFANTQPKSGKVFADTSPRELRALETTLKKLGKPGNGRHEAIAAT